LATYSRNATCTNGHRVTLSFDWDALRTEGPKDYSETCPVAGCGGQVAGKLPVGSDSDTLTLIPGPS
jgi:hypothetical protein